MATRSRTSETKAGRGEERRRARRHPIEIPIEIATRGDMLIHVTSNLSVTGAFFHRAIPFKVGTRVKLRILLPGDEPIACEGVVANIPNAKDLGMGVEFVDISADDQRRIEALAADTSRSE